MSLFDLFIYFLVIANFFSNRSLGNFFHGFCFRFCFGFRFRDSVSEFRIPCFSAAAANRSPEAFRITVNSGVVLKETINKLTREDQHN